MARISVKAGEDYALRLSKLAAASDTVAKKALNAGAGIITDQIRDNLEGLPIDYKQSPDKPYRYLMPGEKFDGVPEAQKQDLLESLGVTPVGVDKNGDYNVKIGFDGYGSQPTAAYPRGIPNPLVARAVESGSSVRQKHPFIAPAVKRKKKEAIEAMQKVIDEESKRIMDR